MNEAQRTLTYVGIAVASLLVAVFAAPAPPKPVAGFTDVGEDFYPDFTNPDDAKTLQVIAYDSAKAESRLFGIEFKDGLWRIPSRHNYPADGKDRLAKCAASIIELKRGNVAGTRAAEHPQFDVVDPLDESTESLNRGQRIKLMSADGKTLADYIIGKAVPNRAGLYYVRRPDENVTYMAKIELDLSTKFADWIEPDLLKLDGNRLVDIEIDNYSIDTERGRIVGRDRSKLSRKNSTDPWALDGLDTAVSEVNQDEVRKLVDELDNMKIVGVRPKPVRLSRELKLGEGLKIDQTAAFDLSTKGFLFARTEDGSQQLVSKEGEVVAKTDQGVMYVLHFGDVFSGTEEEIEFGFAKDSSKDSADKAEAPAADGAEKPDAAPATGKSRYLFVTVQLDPTAIGTKPVEPAEPKEPTKPEGFTEPVADAPADASATSNAGPFAEYLQQKAEYDAQVAGYDAAKAKYQTDNSNYQDKITAGEKVVKELNSRFADWYYVISAGSFEDLRQGREKLTKPKSAADPTEGLPPQLQLPPGT